MPFVSVRFVPALLCAALCGGCAAGATSAARAPSVVPNAAAAVPAGGAVRRTRSGPYCVSNTEGTFNGVPSNGNVAGAPDAVVAGGIFNEACDDWSAVVGGYQDIIGNGSNAAPYSFIGGGDLNHVESGQFGTIAGGYQNTLNVAAPQNGAFIGGGEDNTVTGGTGAIAGGYSNTVSGNAGFVGGGNYNAVSSVAFGAVVEGDHNTASGEGAFVGAGGYNTASGQGAIVGGGFDSTAGGSFATIPGGYVNSAAGTYSFAAGARASAPYTGDFVWSDGSDRDAILTASKAYQFIARASGGVTFWTNAGATVGATLAPGSGAWASASDRNLKTGVAAVDDASVLDKVAALPITRWSYASERGVRHLGPMAQDFYAAFKVGEDDRHITSIDEGGVALAAIKALHGENARLRAEVAGLRAEVAALRALVQGRTAR